MRLLEFNKDEGGANPRRPGSKPQPRKPASNTGSVRPLPAARAHTTTAKPTSPAKRGFPVKGNTLLKPAGVPPIDLEQLQQRIRALEERLGKVSGQSDQQASVKELEQLQQRMHRLETSLEYELWQAKQREHSMMELLCKPTLKTRLRQRYVRFINADIQTIGNSLKRALHSWWQDCQPGWWPQLARNWRESLDKARH